VGSKCGGGQRASRCGSESRQIFAIPSLSKVGFAHLSLCKSDLKKCHYQMEPRRAGELRGRPGAQHAGRKEEQGVARRVAGGARAAAGFEARVGKQRDICNSITLKSGFRSFAIMQK
jgi:hypothetical protein